MKKYILAVCILLTFGVVSRVHAEVKITEIMYDLPGTDTDREWIEIYNDTQSPVSLSGWKFFDGSNHNLVEPPQNGGRGSLTLLSHDVAILAADANTFLSENSSYNGTVIDTVMSLGNTGDTLRLINKDGVTVFETTYQGVSAQGDGNSLHYQNGAWVSGMPSPGSLSVSAPTTAVSSLPPPPEYVPPKERKMQILIDVPTATFVEDLSYQLSGSVYNVDNNPILFGYFVWSFGDGNTKTQEVLQPIEYSYAYPGTYALTFSYYYQQYDAKPVISKRVTITVVPATISIGQIYSDGSFELKNGSENELNLSGWVAKARGVSFIFPLGTILLPEEHIVIPGSVTHFSPGIKKEDIEIDAPNAAPVIMPPKLVVAKQVVKPQQGVVLAAAKKEVSIVPENSAATRPDTAIEDQSTQPENKNNSWTLFFVALVALVLVGTVVFSTKKPSLPIDEADSFTITEIQDS
jgi:hypothetical protein